MILSNIRKHLINIYAYITFWLSNRSIYLIFFKPDNKPNIERINNLKHMRSQLMKRRRRSYLFFSDNIIKPRKKIGFGLIRANFKIKSVLLENPLFFFNSSYLMNRLSYYLYKYYYKIANFVFIIIIIVIFYFILYLIRINIVSAELQNVMCNNAHEMAPDFFDKMELNFYNNSLFRGPLKTNAGLLYIFDDIIFSKVFHEKINNLTNRLGYLGVQYNMMLVPMNNWNNFHGATSITFPFLQCSEKQARAAALGFQDINLLEWDTPLRPMRYANMTNLEVLDNMGNLRRPLGDGDDFRENELYKRRVETMFKHRESFRFARRFAKLPQNSRLLASIKENFHDNTYFINKGLDLIKENHTSVFYHKDFMLEVGVSDAFLSANAQEALNLFQRFFFTFFDFFSYLIKKSVFNIYFCPFEIVKEIFNYDGFNTLLHYFENNTLLALREISLHRKNCNGLLFLNCDVFSGDFLIKKEFLSNSVNGSEHLYPRREESIFIQRLENVAEENRIINLLKFRYKKHPETGAVKFRTGLDFYVDFITSLPFADPPRGFFSSDFLNINDFLYDKDVVALLREVDNELKRSLNSYLVRFDMVFESLGSEYSLFNTYTKVETPKYGIDNNIFYDKVLFEHFTNYSFRVPLSLEELFSNHCKFKNYLHGCNSLILVLKKMHEKEVLPRKGLYSIEFLLKFLDVEIFRKRKMPFTFYVGPYTLGKLSIMHTYSEKFHYNYLRTNHEEKNAYFFNFLRNLVPQQHLHLGLKLKKLSNALKFDLHMSLQHLRTEFSFFYKELSNEKRTLLFFRRYALGLEQAIGLAYDSTFQEQYYHGKVWNQTFNRAFYAWKDALKNVDASKKEIKKFVEEQEEAQLATYSFHNVQNNLLFCENIVENKPLARQIFAPSSFKIRYRKYTPDIQHILWDIFVDPFLPFIRVKHQFTVVPNYYAPTEENFVKINWLLHNNAKCKFMNTRLYVDNTKLYPKDFESRIVNFKFRNSLNYYRKFFREEETKGEILSLCNWLFSTNVTLDFENTKSYIISYITSNFLSLPLFKSEIFELYKVQMPFHIKRQYLFLEHPMSYRLSVTKKL